MDIEHIGQSPYDMGVVTFRDVRLDCYRPMGGIGEAEYHIEIRVHGDKTKLFIVREGGLANLVGRFLELVSLLLGESRVNGTTAEVANAIFHGLGGELADLLSKGRANSRKDCDSLAEMDHGEQPWMPESDGTRASDASVSASVRTPTEALAKFKEEGWDDFARRTGGMPPHNSQCQTRSKP